MPAAASGARSWRKARIVSWKFPLWTPLGALLGRLGRFLDCLGAPWGRPKALGLLGRLGAIRGAYWGVVNAGKT
eukprot:4777278-Pyramimonas_sp.AAC.1